MAMAHFFGGEKGGVGKSFVTRTAIQWHLDRAVDFALFDADYTNLDIKRIYKSCGCREAIFSQSKEDEDKALSIYEEAEKRTTLVNLPAHTIKPFTLWFEENEIFEIADEDGIEFTIWFVCNGSPDSYQHFGDYLSYFQGRVKHVLVKNWGLSKKWKAIEENAVLMEKIEQYNVKVVDFPEFKGEELLGQINDNNQSFGEAKDYSGYRHINRQRVKSFLKKAYSAFDNSGVFYSSLSPQNVTPKAKASPVPPKPQVKPQVTSLVVSEANGKKNIVKNIVAEELEKFQEYI